MSRLGDLIPGCSANVVAIHMYAHPRHIAGGVIFHRFVFAAVYRLDCLPYSRQGSLISLSTSQEPFFPVFRMPQWPEIHSVVPPDA